MTRGKSSLLSEQVYKKIAKAIQDGEYPKGEFLPSERALIKEHSVSRPTVRKALARLEKEGFLSCRPGVGYQVQRKTRERSKAGTSKVVGLIVSFWSDQQTGGIRILERQFSERGYSVLLGMSDLDVAMENDCIDRFLNVGAAGFVIIPAVKGRGSSRLADLIREKFPVIALGQPREWHVGESLSNKVSVVGLDNAATMNTMLSHLYEEGHRRIGLVGEDPMKDIKTIREHTYLEFMRKHDVKTDPRWIISVNTASVDTGREQLRRALSDKANRPTALVCQGYDIAAHMTRLLTLEGISVPEDISLTSFGIQEALQETFTNVSYSAEEYATEAVQALIAQIEGSATRKKVLLLPELFIKQSSAPPACETNMGVSA